MPARLALTVLALSLFLVGCRRDEVTSYRVPKETAPTVPGVNAPAAPSEGAALAWSAPDHWQDQGATGVRRGSYTIPGPDGTSADLSIIAFPGDVGGLAANVNRWRGQVGLPAVSADDVQASVEHIHTNYFHVDLVSMTGEANGTATRIDGAIFSHGSESWFIKVMGPADLVAAEEANFRRFVNSITPAQP